MCNWVYVCHKTQCRHLCVKPEVDGIELSERKMLFLTFSEAFLRDSLLLRTSASTKIYFRLEGLLKPVIRLFLIVLVLLPKLSNCSSQLWIRGILWVESADKYDIIFHHSINDLNCGVQTFD